MGLSYSMYQQIEDANRRASQAQNWQMRQKEHAEKQREKRESISEQWRKSEKEKMIIKNKKKAEKKEIESEELKLEEFEEIEIELE